MVILDDSSVSYCYYSNSGNKRLLDFEILERTIKYAMLHNLKIHYIYPNYELPKEYNDLIDSHASIKIKSINTSSNADIIVINDFDFDLQSLPENSTIVFRISLDFLIKDKGKIVELASKVKRLNLVLLDATSFTKEDFLKYKNVLNYLTDNLDLQNSELNLLHDRLVLDKMNNCNPGVDSICLAPDGEFYLCPAFYYANEKKSVGNLARGISIKNAHLLRLENAPICRHCDAFQCKRCIWQNYLTTLEINTPSHEQCVKAHIERNASVVFLEKCRKMGLEKYKNVDIKELDYLDPFENKSNW